MNPRIDLWWWRDSALPFNPVILGMNGGGNSCSNSGGSCGPGGPAVCVIGSQGNLPMAGTDTQYCYGSGTLSGSVCSMPAQCSQV